MKIVNIDQFVKSKGFRNIKKVFSNDEEIGFRATCNNSNKSTSLVFNLQTNQLLSYNENTRCYLPII